METQNIFGFIQINSTYRFKTSTGSGIGFFFKPLNPDFPLFIVSFNQSHKYSQNIPAIIKFSKFINEFPIGNILETFDNSSLYIFYAKFYNIFPQRFKPLLNLETYLSYLQNSDRELVYNIISIDPIDCVDIDDAISIFHDKIQIHITDLPFLLEFFNLSDLINFNLFSSIYLPNSTIHMLPSTLLKFSSLIQNEWKPLLTIEINFDTFETRIFKSKGKIYKNYSYETFDASFTNIKLYSQISSLFFHFTKLNKDISNSHQFIECLMILYNFILSTYLPLNKRIFRNNIFIDKPSTIHRSSISSFDDFQIKDDLTEEKQIKDIIFKTSSSYSFINNGHVNLSLDSYLQATSPIRRLNDIINQYLIFYNKDLIIDLDKINSKEKILKRFYKKINQFELANKLYSYGTFEILNTIILNKSSDFTTLYLEKYKIILKYKKCVDKDEGSIFKIKLWGIPNPENIELSLKIEEFY